jgi:hypothetical protein
MKQLLPQFRPGQRGLLVFQEITARGTTRRGLGLGADGRHITSLLNPPIHSHGGAGAT